MLLNHASGYGRIIIVHAMDAPAGIFMTLMEMKACRVILDASRPALAFAAAEMTGAAVARGLACERCGLERLHEPPPAGCIRLVLAVTPEEHVRVAAVLGMPVPSRPAPQGYVRRVKGEPSLVAVVFAGDIAGALYGAIDLAEWLLQDPSTELRDHDAAPHIAQRGIKFNIPLDARTPSYSDAGDSAQQNIPEVWSLDFWHDYLDAMARYRFNVLTLWNLHPFPSLVKVPEYPEVALDDVWRTRAVLDDRFSLRGEDMVRSETLRDVEVVRRLTIEDKIAFWRAVMQYADERCIAVYLFTWNIYTFGTGGKYGITPAQDNVETIRYFRASVRELVLTYPLLAGIGITAGEQIESRPDAFDKETWLWRAYGEGIRDAKARDPGRRVRLIHRYHETALDDILNAWREYPDTLDLSYKYAIAHLYADPAPPFAREALAALPPTRRMWMTLRPDDFYSFRWADPEFVRTFVRALPGNDQLAGFYLGPDGYTWGRETIATEPDTPRQLVLQKQWLTFMLWGHLSYDPTLPDAHFQQVFAARFPGRDSAALYTALVEASRIIPLVNRFHWEPLDFQWFPEACYSHARYARGFHTVNHFRDGRPMPGSEWLSVTEYVAADVRGVDQAGGSPMQVIAQLRTHARAAMAGANAAAAAGTDKAWRETVGDIKALAHLGFYYACKIEGAVALARLAHPGHGAAQAQAVAALEQALRHWQDYAAAATAQYRPQRLTRLGNIDLNALTEQVAEDIQIARNGLD